MPEPEYIEPFAENDGLGQIDRAALGGFFPVDYELVLAWMKHQNVGKAIAEVKYPFPEMATAVLMSDRGKEVMRNEYAKRMKRLRLDADLLTVDAYDLFIKARDESDHAPALAALKFTAAMIGVDPETKAIASNNGVQIVFNCESGPNALVAASSEQHAEAMSLSGRGYGAGDIQQAVLRGAPTPVHEDP